MCSSTVKEDRGGLSSWKLQSCLLGITWLACFAQGAVGLEWWYLGEHHVFGPKQEAVCPERTHISNDRMNLSSYRR